MLGDIYMCTSNNRTYQSPGNTWVRLAKLRKIPQAVVNKVNVDMGGCVKQTMRDKSRLVLAIG